MAHDLLLSGTLIRIRPDPGRREDIPFATAGSSRAGLLLYERIDLQSYPSCNDFFGYTINVDYGTYGIVVGYVGYPFRVSWQQATPVQWDFNVYTVLVGSTHVQVFGCDIVEVAPDRGTGAED